MSRDAMSLLLLACVAGCDAGEPATETAGEAATETAAERAAAPMLDAEARSADGVPIRFDVLGSGEPTLVLVHGWTNGRWIWGEHVRTLSRTHRVVALDLAGHGGSGVERSEWTIDAFGEDVVAVVDQLDLDRVVLVGFSMGGAVVLEAAERLGDRVLGLVFVDTFHDPEQRVTVAEAVQMEAMFRANLRDTAFLRAFAYSPDAPDSLVRRLHQRMPAEPHEHWFPAMRALFAWLDTEFQPTLQRIEVPVAAINTTRVPTDVEAIRRYAPSFTVDTMHGVGHAGILERRIDDFDARLLAIVARFASTEAGGR